MEEINDIKIKQSVMAEKINNIEKQCGEIKCDIKDIKHYVEKAAENSIQSHKELLKHVENNFAKKYTEKLVYGVVVIVIGYILKEILANIVK